MDTKERPNTAAIRTLREKIKALASGQRPIKRARKTLISNEERKDLLTRANVDAGWIKDGGKEAAAHACWIVYRRRAEITACLNLSHELRGSKHRHGVREIVAYDYAKAMDALREELKL